MIAVQEAVVGVFGEREGVGGVSSVHFHFEAERAGRHDRIGDRDFRLAAALSREGVFVHMAERNCGDHE